MRVAAFLLVSGLAVSADTGFVDLLRSKEVGQRLEGIAYLARKGHPDAEKHLLKALKDRDWEVIHRATEALAARGSDASIEPLIQLALTGPIRRIRLAASASVKKLAADSAADRIQKKLRGPTVFAAADALEVIANPLAAKSLERLLKNKEGTVRAAAVRALGALRDPGRVDQFADLLDDPDIRVRAAAVDALVATGDATAVVPLREGMKTPQMTAVMQRRHIEGIRALLLSLDPKKRDFAAARLASAFGMAGHARIGSRFARLLGSLGRKDAPIGPVSDYVRTLQGNGLAHAEVSVRSASAAALARIQSPNAYDRIESAAKGDASPRVRFHALRAAVALRGDMALPLLLDRLAHDADAGVREEAATVCGKRRLHEALNPLRDALKDNSWEVRTCAAVSLGNLRDIKGVNSLGVLYGSKDWRDRGAAVVGLGWINQKTAVPLLITALRDRDAAVAFTALEFLRHISGSGLGGKSKLWREWWKNQEKTFVFRDPDAAAKKAKKYGYAVEPRRVYEDLDIVVLQTRRGGDNIQFLLTDYGIDFRIVRAGSVPKIGLHPYALFVANCPGEITSKDAERIGWYVRAGGYLFASCWALTHTVGRCFPGIVRKLKTRAQVVDTVQAVPCPSHSPFTEGVFDDVTQPLYELLGSHLIDVIDPERFEVLIDSPETATNWGDGNLAGWFTVGHGVVLDSANHFDLQGMRNARLRDEKERMAFAVNHLGYDYAALRELKAEGVFAKQPLAIKRTRDLSIFRFITTFVRQKRLADDGVQVSLAGKRELSRPDAAKEAGPGG